MVMSFPNVSIIEFFPYFFRQNEVVELLAPRMTALEVLCLHAGTWESKAIVSFDVVNLLTNT